MNNENEDYWEESEIVKTVHSRPMGGFSMHDDEVLQQVKKDGFKEDAETTLIVKDIKRHVPLHKLVSEKSLNKILEADNQSETSALQSSKIPLEEEVKLLRRQVMDRWTVPDVNNTIKRMLLGLPHSLELYKSMDDKKSLLNTALAMGDGDTILAVVLFLFKTLKRSLFNQILMTNPVAATHYISYLTTRMQIQDLTDIFTMLGRSKDASMNQFELACRNPQRQLQRLKSCLHNHFSNDKDKIHVENFIKLLEWQQQHKIPNAEDMSVVDCLAYVCEEHWSQPPGSPLSHTVLVQQHNVSDKQMQWIVLSVRGQVRAWSDIESYFMAKSWIGGCKPKASSIPIEQVVLKLQALNCPTNVLLSYLALIDNMDEKMAVARLLKSPKVIIGIYAQQRDRQGLVNYQTDLNPHSEDYVYAMHLLQSPSIKWKN